MLYLTVRDGQVIGLDDTADEAIKFADGMHRLDRGQGLTIYAVEGHAVKDYEEADDTPEQSTHVSPDGEHVGDGRRGDPG